MPLRLVADFPGAPGAVPVAPEELADPALLDLQLVVDVVPGRVADPHLPEFPHLSQTRFQGIDRVGPEGVVPAGRPGDAHAAVEASSADAARGAFEWCPRTRAASSEAVNVTLGRSQGRSLFHVVDLSAVG
ncbi:hypothetical protein VT84_12015 [Gemmata sp. SH-PL17]|uniref:hypothetical protein n=1 Tax=Gemmata sp. SH-PL17 TaxID=1630693 RepID=UPI00078BC556|nr:hypothetical protein [Gemmata sp. SH-PL17]AMV25115.1 hypothetical protein VT84_12015 [Gemmata sp. SH-PL17]